MSKNLIILMFFAAAAAAASAHYAHASPNSTLDLTQFYNSSAASSVTTIAHADNTSLQILRSSDGSYAWQFFPYNNRTQRLLVVLSTLYNSTVIWIANRNYPVSSNASLALHLPSFTLALHDANGSVAWSPSVSNISSIVMNGTGNLFFLNIKQAVLWQSFDDPTDTMVPGQILHTNHSATASLAWNDWAAGHYTLKADPGGAVLYASFDAQQNMIPYELINYVSLNTSITASLYSACNRTSILYNSDASGVSLVQYGGITTECQRESNDLPGAAHGIYFATHTGGSGFRFLRLMSNGDIYSFYLSNSTGLFVDNRLFEGYFTVCKLPSYCGINSLCSSGNCSCPSLFQPLDPSDPTQGCQPQTPLNCSIFRQHKFLQIAGAAYYANDYVTPRQIVKSASDCTDLCLANCSCTAAFYSNDSGNCYLYDQLRTMQYGSSPTVTAFLRVAHLPDVDDGVGSGSLISKQAIIGISVGGTVMVVILVVLVTWISRRLVMKPASADSDSEEEAFLEGLPGLPPRFSYRDLHDATEGFSKGLGAGGSGAVYEGNILLPSSDDHIIKSNSNQQAQHIKVAVKALKLSEHSSIAAASKRQFRAEVATLGSMSHVNLVRLRGFCAERSHRLLIYEFIENGSLDKWIFDTGNPSKCLSWEVRYRIALDTARGLAFLHEECRDKVMHLDIKPQNILLDGAFRAKLADFGLSKLMERGKSQTVTAIRGTPGYMAPEWFLNLPITEKSDVFSYGMVLLELVGGRKNLNLAVATSEEWYFPAWALRQAESGQVLNVVDKHLLAQLRHDISSSTEVGNDDGAHHSAALAKMERLIKVAFWCIQEDATSRPSMTTVLLMLEEHLQVPDPPLHMAYVPRVRQAAALTSTTTNTTSSSATPFSAGDITVSAVSPR